MMTSLREQIYELCWHSLGDSLNEKGYAVLPGFFTEKQCADAVELYDNPSGFRKTVVMERFRFGRGEYKYFDYPLPDLINELRELIYPKLVSTANNWMNKLRLDLQFPETLAELHELCRDKGQMKPTPLILKYGSGGFNTLHQDIYGEVFFPIQAAVFLNESDCDYTGGEFVMTKQVPRAQSRAIVLKPRKGDLLLFTTQFLPQLGARGYYRVTMKHGVSEVLSGERHTLGIIFHDAQK